MLIIQGDTRKRLGFLLTENYDLGTAQKVNSLYNCILGISPFSKNERNKFDKPVPSPNV